VGGLGGSAPQNKKTTPARAIRGQGSPVVGVAGFEPTTSSSRSNPEDRVITANAQVNKVTASVGVQGRIALSGPVVTQFVTRLASW
jgi:hypothetical protein